MTTKQKSKKLHIFLCMFFGLCGFHKLYEGKYLMFFLYLCSFGLFFIGWAYDIHKILNNQATDRYKNIIVYSDTQDNNFFLICLAIMVVLFVIFVICNIDNNNTETDNTTNQNIITTTKATTVTTTVEPTTESTTLTFDKYAVLDDIDRCEANIRTEFSELIEAGNSSSTGYYRKAKEILSDLSIITPNTKYAEYGGSYYKLIDTLSVQLYSASKNIIKMYEKPDKQVKYQVELEDNLANLKYGITLIENTRLQWLKDCKQFTDEEISWVTSK